MTTPQPTESAPALHRALLRGLSVVTVLAAMAALARVAQDMVIAWRLGAGPVVDAYTYLTNIFSLPGALALTTLTLLVAPVEARGSAPRWRAEMLGTGLLVALLAWPVAAVVGQAWLSSEAAGLNPAVRAVALQGVLPLSLLVPLGMLGALLTAWLVAADRQFVSLAEALAPLVLSGALLVVGTVTVLLWATVGGLALQVLLLALLLRAAGAWPRPRLGLADPQWRLFARGASVMLAGQALFALVPLVDPLFAAQLHEGSLATLGYANRLVLGVMGLAGLALQRVGLPLLARASKEDAAQARAVALRWAAVGATAGALLGLLVAATADPLVSLLFERGRFGVAEREAVAGLLRLGMLQLPGLLAGMALVVALAAASAHRALAGAAAAGLAVKLAASALLAPQWGAPGLMIATAMMYTATTLVTAWALCTSTPATSGKPNTPET